MNDSIAAPSLFCCKTCTGFIAASDGEGNQPSSRRFEHLLRMAIRAESAENCLLMCRSAAHCSNPLVEEKLLVQCETALKSAKGGQPGTSSSVVLQQLRQALKNILQRAERARRVLETWDKADLVRGDLDRRVLHAITVLSCVPLQGLLAKVEAEDESRIKRPRTEGQCVCCALPMPGSAQLRTSWSGGDRQHGALPPPSRLDPAVERAGYFLLPQEMRILQALASFVSTPTRHPEQDQPPAIPYEALRPFMSPLERDVLQALARCRKGATTHGRDGSEKG